MNNKHGYTLIEIIAVIAIVASVGIYGVITLTKVLNREKQEKYDNMITDLKASAETYFNIYSASDETLADNLYRNSQRLVITISELKQALLVNQNLKDPRNNQPVDGCVIMTYNGAVNYQVCIDENCSCN